MNIEDKLQEQIIKAIKEVYKANVNPSEITLQKTKKEFKGHYTLITFPLLKTSKKSPEQTAREIGSYLSEKLPFISEFNVIKGFLNLSISSSMWIEELMKINNTPDFGFTPVTNKSPLYMVEYSSPNTNKPLHLGHVRNNLLGHSLSEILKANGVKVVKTNLVNDRGIHICKSMVAWEKWGNGETPQSSGKKGDHLVGDYYVLFEKNYKAEIEELMKQGLPKEEAVKKPVTVKTRLGWDENSKIIVTLAEQLQDCGIAGLTIHGRTRSQMYKGEADWTLIKEVKSNPRMQIPIIGNGDIDSPEVCKQRFEDTGVDAVMIGRATFGCPWIFREVKHFLRTGKKLPPESFRWYLDVLKQQVLGSVHRLGERRGILHSRRHLAATPLFKGIPDFKQTRIAMLRANTLKELFAILDEIPEKFHLD